MEPSRIPVSEFVSTAGKDMKTQLKIKSNGMLKLELHDITVGKLIALLNALDAHNTPVAVDLKNSIQHAWDTASPNNPG